MKTDYSVNKAVATACVKVFYQLIVFKSKREARGNKMMGK